MAGGREGGREGGGVGEFGSCQGEGNALCFLSALPPSLPPSLPRSLTRKDLLHDLRVARQLRRQSCEGGEGGREEGVR